MTGENHSLYYVALSILSHPGKLGIWKNLAKYPAHEHYSFLSQRMRLSVQDFIAPVYGSDPLKASEKILETSEKKGIHIITFSDPRYPSLLREISTPPPVIYRRGSFSEMKLVAVVGTRNSDPVSESIAARISAELSSVGYGIISGMAVGIDRSSHMAVLEKGGCTVGVLANGLDILYPAKNRDLFRMIDESEYSSLVSEYPPSVRPGKWTFVRRNRIISGMAGGTVVVKAGIKSGALITAGYAAEQGREVFVCPGNSFDRGYQGCINLIKNGAAPVFETGDILSELPEKVRERIEICELNFSPNVPEEVQAVSVSDNLTPLEEKVLELVLRGLPDIDAIVRKLETETSQVTEAIMALEFSGRICREGNFLRVPVSYS
jgi:DNA processing protein